MTIASSTWTVARAAEALNALARCTGLAGAQAPLGLEPTSDPRALDDDALTRYLDAAGAPLGIDAEPLSLTYGEIAIALRRAGPILVRVGGGLLAVMRGGRRALRLLAPDLTTRRVPVGPIVAALRAPLERKIAPAIDRWLDGSGLLARCRARVRATVLGPRLAAQPLEGVWMLRRAAATSFVAGLRHDGSRAHLVGVTLTYALQSVLAIASWLALGQAALSGRVDAGWLAAWVLLSLTLVPARLLSRALQGRLTARVGAALKRHLLAGALQLDPDTLRAEGAGQLLGRALDATFLDELALAGGVAGLFAVVELVGAGVVMAFGAGGLVHVGLLIAFGAVVVYLTWRYRQHVVRWTAARNDMTNATVEQMVGHRTRVAQLRPERWHDSEDQTLAHNLELERRADAASAALVHAPRAWLIVGFVGVAPAFVASTTPAAIAVAIGGIVLAFQAWDRLAQAVADLVVAHVAWARTEPLDRAASCRPDPGMPELALAASGELGRATVPVLDAQDLGFRHGGRSESVLRGVSLTVRPGDRLLIDGPSGGGKSTLAALLSGARRPSEGLLLLGGLDAASLGVDGWRRRVAAAPQFHENHVVTETLAFNLLMGRRWPARPDDLVEAEAVCTELGLGPLLARMPAGIMQMVGEGGWQLSHGERSRVYLARALLQGAEAVILDESFGALDPDTVEQCVACLERRAPTLVVIAHP